MQYILAPHPALHGEHPQNQQRHRPDPRFVQGLDRKRRNRGIHQKRKCQSFRHNEYWCTGKDSNLRTSLGGTDLQSVGFNHSPTCAETAKLRFHRKHLLPTALDGVYTRGLNLQAATTQKKQESREHTRAGKPLHVGKIPNGVRLENLLRRCFRSAG